MAHAADTRVARAANIIRDAGGEIVGRTRLQKLAFLLEVAGLGDGFTFGYYRFGPYSEELANSARNARLLGILHEDERPTDWGGCYSVFSTKSVVDDRVPEARHQLARMAAKADPVELELAATAVFLHLQGVADAWAETARRKPEKADPGVLKSAKALYEDLRRIPTPNQLPKLP